MDRWKIIQRIVERWENERYFRSVYIYRYVDSYVLIGEGIFKWPDGQQYEGEYKNDQKNGQGIFTWPDGRKFIGNWVDGKIDGIGTFIGNVGNIKQGVWENGKRLKWMIDKKLKA